MLDLEVELRRMRQREMLAAAERERIFRRARRAARDQRALEGGGTLRHVAHWRLWLGRRLIQWGTVLAADGVCQEAELGQVCC